MKLSEVRGLLRRFCGAACAEGYASDRRNGIIRPPWKLDGKQVDHEKACERQGLCRYCEMPLKWRVGR